MNRKAEATIMGDLNFRTMVRARNRFALILSILVLVIYFIFIGIASFNPQLLAQTVGNSAITIGMPIAALVIIVSWLITGVYIYVTNRHFDQLKEKIKKEHHYE